MGQPAEGSVMKLATPKDAEGISGNPKPCSCCIYNGTCGEIVLDKIWKITVVSVF